MYETLELNHLGAHRLSDAELREEYGRWASAATRGDLQCILLRDACKAEAYHRHVTGRRVEPEPEYDYNDWAARRAAAGPVVPSLAYRFAS